MIKIAMQPFGKARPRVTRRGTYMPPKYMGRRDLLRALWLEQGCELNIEGTVSLHVDFVFKMAKSWSKKKKAKRLGRFHEQTPDLDNLFGAVMDALLDKDSRVVHLSGSKFWGKENAINIKLDVIDNDQSQLGIA